MREPRAFDPLEVGETDNLVFDFTGDVGAASIVSTVWSCAIAPFQTGLDPAAQSRILSAQAATVINVRSPVDGTLTIKTGAFSVASVGGFPASFAGGTYVLEATAALNDGRVLKRNSTILCKLPGA